MKAILFMSLLLMAFLPPALMLGCNETKIAEKGNDMTQEVTIPPIDASAPTSTETATFALG